MSGEQRFLIVIKKEDGEEITFPFDRRSVTVGSGSTADMRIQGEGVSVSHAVFEKRDDGVFLTDLATPTGTFVNGEKITKKRIEPGDEIRIGSVMLTLKVEGGEEEAVAEAPAEKPEPEAPAPQPEPVEPAKPAEAAAEPPKQEEPKQEEKPEPAEVKEAVQQEVKEEPKEPSKEQEAVSEQEKAVEESKPAQPQESEVAPPDTEKMDEGGSKVEAVKVGVDLEKEKKLKEAKKRRALRRAYVLEVAPRAEKLERVEKKAALEVREIGWRQSLMSVNQYSKSTVEVKIGEGKENDFFIPAEFLPHEPFTLAEKSGDSVTVYFGENQDGTFYDRKEGEKPLKEVAKKEGSLYAVTINPGQACYVHFGNISYYLRFVEAEHVPPMPITQRIDWADLALWIIAYAIWSLLIYQISVMPEPEVPDVLEGKVRAKQVEIEEQKEEEPEEEPEEPLVANNRPAQRAMGEEGRIGDKKALLDKAKGGARRSIAEEIASSSGLLGALDSGNEGRDRMFTGVIDASIAENLGMLSGPTGVDQRGAGGLGARGSGLGGGGTALGIGGLGTLGRGGGYGRYGIGAGRLGKRKGKLAKVGRGRASVKGALSKDIIAKIIRKHLNQIRHCYQKELNKNPNLYGKIVVKFIIGATGRVIRAQVAKTTMNNMAVEDCVVRVIRHILFPKPKGGGIVVVSYPFVFKPL